MITQFILDVLMGVPRLILMLIPNLPPMPEPIPTWGTYLINVVATVLQVAVDLYGAFLFGTIIVLCIALLLFDQIWSLTKFIAKKLPFNVS